MIPESLRRMRRWVNRSGKFPLQTNKQPELWMTYEEAAAKGDVGIQPGPPAPGDQGTLICLDLDWKDERCEAVYPDWRNAVPFETIPEYAQRIIDQQESYVEWSMSGLGIHIFCSGVTETDPDYSPGVEVYGHDHHIACTGRAVCGDSIKPYKTIPKGKPKDKLIKKGDRHNALLSLAGKLKNLSLSEKGIADALVDYAKKNMDLTHSDEPVEIHCAKIASDAAKKWEGPPEITFTNADEFTAMSFPPREPLAATLEGTPILTGYSLNQVFAFRGTGKTLFQMAWAIAMSRGENFLCYTHPEPLVVGYVEGELPNTVIQERLNLLRDGKPLSNLKLFTRDQMPHGFFLDSEQNRDVLSKAVEENKIKVLFLDSSQSLITKPENDQETWIGLTSWLINLRTSGCCVVITRQTGKDQSRGARGHSAAEDLLDVAIQLTQLDPGRGYLNCKLEYTKFRGAGDIRPVHIEKQVHGPWTYTEVDEELAAEIRELKAGGMSNAGIAKELGIRRDRVSKIVRFEEAESCKEEPTLF